jgi:hypothetical protein|tara:strand:- start:1578 stop:1772 length:195 start_codon:yes stop_codon:yes gene_type:complete
MEYEQWYQTVALEEYALETLQEEYCYQYAKVFGKYPLPSVMNRDTLISNINKFKSAPSCSLLAS